LADLENVKLMRYRLTKDNQNFQWRTDFKFLRGQISTRTKAIVLVNPNNPTGHICTADELFAYVDLAKEFDLALIVDEVFSDFLFGPTAFVPLISEGPHVFTLNGFSKLLGLPQLKLGWIHLSGSRRLVEQALGHLEEIADAFLSVNTPVQLAAADLLSLVGPIQSTLMHRLRANLKMADSMLQSSQCVKASPPQAGWSLVLDLDLNRTLPLTSEQFALRLLELNRVHVHGGHLFGFEEGCQAVISLLCPEREFQTGLGLLIQCAESSAHG
jgi:aspartate/methionine/tyrosine aminotransferase